MWRVSSLSRFDGRSMIPLTLLASVRVQKVMGRGWASVRHSRVRLPPSWEPSSWWGTNIIGSTIHHRKPNSMLRWIHFDIQKKQGTNTHNCSRTITEAAIRTEIIRFNLKRARSLWNPAERFGSNHRRRRHHQILISIRRLFGETIPLRKREGCVERIGSLCVIYYWKDTPEGENDRGWRWAEGNPMWWTVTRWSIRETVRDGLSSWDDWQLQSRAEIVERLVRWPPRIFLLDSNSSKAWPIDYATAL